jgi:hypothetical protein
MSLGGILGQPRNRLWVGVTVVALLGAGFIWWRAGADVRRVNAACDAWFHDRAMLRSALLETDEAIGRAEADHAKRVGPYYNDRDETVGQLAGWYMRGADATKDLSKDSASSLERAAQRSIAQSEEGVVVLVKYVRGEKPQVVADWLPEVAARFQNVDDVCLAAARRG